MADAIQTAALRDLIGRKFIMSLDGHARHVEVKFASARRVVVWARMPGGLERRELTPAEFYYSHPWEG